MVNRHSDTFRFYELLDRLAEHCGGPRLLQSCHGRMDWPQNGIYFFYEPGETRAGTGSGGRVVRVGTHGLKRGSQSTLWGRLSQHRGSSGSGRGNHRGSIFRLLVGVALARQTNVLLPCSWGVAGSRDQAARRLNVDQSKISEAEAALESRVNDYIGQMPFLWLNVDDPPGPASIRGLIERNAIALLSNYRSPAPDCPSTDWLGHYSDRERVRISGLWNNNHVEEPYDPGFLNEMESRIEPIRPR